MIEPPEIHVHTGRVLRPFNFTQYSVGTLAWLSFTMANEGDALLGQEQRRMYSESSIEHARVVLTQHSNVDGDVAQKELPAGEMVWVLFALWSAGEPVMGVMLIQSRKLECSLPGST